MAKKGLFDKVVSHIEGEIKANGKKYVSETKYDSGAVERVRFTKTREVHDFDGPNGKMSVWSRKK